jgi:hypothetical protein
MKTEKFILIHILSLLVALILAGCSENSKNLQGEMIVPTLSKSEMEDEAWHMEELYWEYVQNIDTVAYKTLWHDDFIGYPSFGDGVSNKSKIAIWIPEMHKDPDLKFGYTLYKKASNAIDDLVIVFYDADEFWTDEDNKVVRKETYKFTHTWKKVHGNWVILGGMAANKNQEYLNN